MKPESGYRAYPVYKDSGIEWLGEMPYSWNLCSLKYCLIDIFNGTTANQIDVSDETVPVTRIETISDGKINEEKLGYIIKTEATDRFRLKVCDILFSNINSLKMIGNCAIYEHDNNLYAGMNLLVLRPREMECAKWLFWLIRSSIFREVVESLAKPAINQASIPQSSLSNIKIPIICLEEQQAIAAFLDRETAKIDDLIAKQERLIALLVEKRLAVISHAVTKGLDPTVRMKDSGIEWLGAMPECWNLVRLKQITVDKCDGPFGSGLKSEHYVEDGVRVVRLQNIRKGLFDDSDAAFIDPEYYKQLGGHDVHAHDVLIAGLGDERNTVGRACVAPIEIEPAMVKADCFRFRLDICRALPVFVAAQLTAGSEHDAGRLSSGSTRSRITLSIMASRYLALPPLIEQYSIMEFLTMETAKVEILTNKVQRSIELLKERRSALISAVVTGKIDVRGMA